MCISGSRPIIWFMLSSSAVFFFQKSLASFVLHILWRPDRWCMRLWCSFLIDWCSILVGRIWSQIRTFNWSFKLCLIFDWLELFVGSWFWNTLRCLVLSECLGLSKSIPTLRVVSWIHLMWQINLPNLSSPLVIFGLWVMVNWHGSELCFWRWLHCLSFWSCILFFIKWRSSFNLKQFIVFCILGGLILPWSHFIKERSALTRCFHCSIRMRLPNFWIRYSRSRYRLPSWY